MEPVPVLFLIDQLCGMAGAERVLIHITRGLPRDRFRPLVGALRSDPNPEIVRQLGCPVHVFPLRRTYDAAAFRIARNLRNLIRSEQVQVVHTFFETADLWGGLVARASGCPVVVSSRRDMGFNQSPKHRLAYRLLRPVFSQVQTVSEQVRRVCVEKESLREDRVVTVYNGVDVDKIALADGVDQLRALLLGGDTYSRIVLTVGNIRRIKGMDVLARAAADVCRRFPQTLFVVAGKVLEPDYFESVRGEIAALGLTANFAFLGSSDNVFSLFKASDVFCLPSRSEGFSNALLEAMACGVPCVATDVGGNREALEDGKSGYLVAVEDAPALAARMIELFEHPEQARDMGQYGCRAVAQNFTTQAMVRKIVGLYDALLSRVA